MTSPGVRLSAAPTDQLESQHEGSRATQIQLDDLIGVLNWDRAFAHGITFRRKRETRSVDPLRADVRHLRVVGLLSQTDDPLMTAAFQELRLTLNIFANRRAVVRRGQLLNHRLNAHGHLGQQIAARNLRCTGVL